MAANKNILTANKGRNCYIDETLYKLIEARRNIIEQEVQKKDPKKKVSTAYASLEVANLLMSIEVSYDHEKNIFMNPLSNLKEIENERK